MELIDFYKSILKEGLLTVEESGFINASMNLDNPIPAFVKKKRLCLPTHEILTTPNTGDRIVFHPLKEAINRGESDVMLYFRTRVNTRLNLSIAAITLSLTRLIASTADHPKLSPDQTNLMLATKDADSETFKRIGEIMRKMLVSDPATSFINIYVNRGGEVDGQKYKRAAIVSFPLYEEVIKTPAKGSNKIWGVDVRKADRSTLKSLIEYYFPDVATPGKYSCGSDSLIAPSLECLLGSLIKLGNSINQVTNAFKEYIPDYQNEIIGGDWVNEIGNIEKFVQEINRIPMQEGNEGSVPVKKEIPSVQVGAVPPTITTDAVAAQVQSQAQHQQIPQPAVTNTQPQPQAQEPAAQPVVRRLGDDSAPVDLRGNGAPAQPHNFPGASEAQATVFQPFQQQMMPVGFVPNGTVGYPQPAQVQMPVQPQMPAIPPGMAMTSDGRLVPVQQPQQPQVPGIPPGMMMLPNGQLVPAPQQQTAPQVKTTANGVDVNSFFQANPQLAMAAQAAAYAGMQPQMPVQMMQQPMMPPAPRWAQQQPQLPPLPPGMMYIQTPSGIAMVPQQQGMVYR